MSGGFSNKPKILRGAFVEYGLTIPPLFVVFQYNPVELTRSRSLSFAAPSETQASAGSSDEESEALTQWRAAERNSSLRDWHKETDLMDIQKDQQVTIQEESISFDIRLDATDKLNDGDFLAQEFGIAPQLAALEMMVHPKSESLLGQALDALIGSEDGFSFTRSENPPMILFIWGIKRVLPVNINSMNIKETEFNTHLDPIRATVSVSLTVVEGQNLVYTYSKAMKEAMAVLNLANIADIANVVIPG
jgi:hypothetical protein